VAALDPVEARHFFQGIKDAVTKGDKASLARMVEYPITVPLGKRDQEIRTPEAFVKHYEEIINENLKAAVGEQTFETLFVNYDGVMIGNGVIWFSGLADADGTNKRIRIIAVNNWPFKSKRGD
jgi:hypothetical protein